MGVRILKTAAKRDWAQLAADAAEIAIQLIALGPNGFSNAISALVRIVRGQRGTDSLETKATTLLLETLSFGIATTIASIKTERQPAKLEVQTLIAAQLNRAMLLLEQANIIFEAEHLGNPSNFSIFSDAADQLAHHLKVFGTSESPDTIKSQFRKQISEGFHRIRARDIEYFSDVIAALSGPDVQADGRSRAWERYRSALITRFEDEPLFGEAPVTGVTLGQVYQPLRAWWGSDDEVRSNVAADKEGSHSQRSKKERRNLGLLQELTLGWLAIYDSSDCTRLISGGPGSGKSTFAKQLAATLSLDARWRVLVVPLQRLRGSGPLENRINEYFRLQLDEPFDGDSLPLTSLGRDGHDDWVIIFDGLDELAKEGAGSESAAQDFASSLADWRGRVSTVRVRFVVLGRAPSMQEARRRLGLYGAGTMHVVDMAPIQPTSDVTYVDPLKLTHQDQRPEFWRRWAVAKHLHLDPPEAMRVDELTDLTKEPLLAYLLILSGYASERWQEAAENRNRIYKAIFDQIWERERTKPSRIQLNDLGQDGFEFLMQSLGLAAWRGGGRTGDSATFSSVRDTYVRPDLLAKAKALGVADLSNVALLFYTRKDEEGGQGYEFLHKSFGEYLTACGLFGAFQRWGYQVADTTRDFDSIEFLRRWLMLAGPTAISPEIVNFLQNEVRLQADVRSPDQPWKLAREWTNIGSGLLDTIIRDGAPAHETAKSWRSAEIAENNAELSLVALLNACADVAYPLALLNQEPQPGAWTPGPIQIPAFTNDKTAFALFITRQTAQETSGYVSSGERPIIGSRGLVLKMLSRLSLQGVSFSCRTLLDADLVACDFSGAEMTGTLFCRSNLSYCDFRGAQLEHCTLELAILRKTDFRGTELDFAYFDADQIKHAITDKPFRPAKPLVVPKKKATRSSSKPKPSQ